MKLADFGLSLKLKGASDGKVQKCGTLSYMAPEMLQDVVDISPAIDL